MKIYELARTVQLFEKASKDAELRQAIPAVVTASFGIFPLSLKDRTMTAACPDWVDGRMLSIIEQGLGLRICPLYYDHEIILGYITKVYLQERLVNINTFGSADFMEKADPSEILMEKPDGGDGCRMSLPVEAVLFMDVSFRSTLRNLDRKEGYPFFSAGDLNLPFRRQNGSVRVFSGPVGDETFCMLKRSNLYSGVENSHGFAEHRLASLPFSIHPTEVQIQGIEPDGTVVLNVYDRREAVSPGEVRGFRCRYFFLHFGNRYERSIDVRIHDLWVSERSDVVVENRQPSWTDEDLTRWLGLDWRDVNPSGA